MTNVKQIIKKNFCSGCGTCFSLCPKGAIKLILDKKRGLYMPEINEEKCNNCGICLKVCPLNGAEDKAPQRLEGLSKSILLGNYIKCYSGYAGADSIRYNASSGGAITALLIFALEKGLIDGAIVTRFSNGQAESFIARTKEEIIQASQSKYCPVPVNSILKQILTSEKPEKLAAVGLPCQISGIRKALNVNDKLKKIVLYLGLFCNHMPNMHSLDYFLSKNRIKKEEIKKINYRGEGWPGNFRIKSANKTIAYSFPMYWSIAGSSFFYPKACMACSDCLSENADISFGDAWLPEFNEDKNGTSLLICRTEIGQNILKAVQEAGILKLNAIEPNKVLRCQIPNIYLKKKGFGCLFPARGKQYIKTDFFDRLLVLTFFFNSIIGTGKLFRRFLSLIPVKIFYFYCGFLGRIWYKKAKHDFKDIIQKDGR